MCSADCDVMSCLHMAELCNVEKKPWTSVIHITGLGLVVFSALFALPFLRWYIAAISNSLMAMFNLNMLTFFIKIGTSSSETIDLCKYKSFIN